MNELKLLWARYGTSRNVKGLLIVASLVALAIAGGAPGASGGAPGWS
jgi:hypothetical protein